jgi:putative nucleotidyltransferase with HDIG domain
VSPRVAASAIRGRARALSRTRLPVQLEGLVEQRREQRSRPVERRELLVETAGALMLLALAVAWPVLSGAGAPPTGPAIAVVAALALAHRVEFNVGAGCMTPIQLVFVPLLFVAGPEWVLALVVAGLLLARVGDILTDGGGLARQVVVATGNAWFAVGPALVLAAFGVGQPDWQDWPVLALALLALFATDTATGAVREWAVSGVPPRLQLRVMGLVLLVDGLLAPIGLLAAIASEQAAYAFLGVLPLAALLAVFARERNARIDQQIELSTAYRGTAMLLAEVITADDAYTGDHSHGVLELALACADELGVDADERRLVELGALLHDVGKISVPDAIINKDGPLDESEWEIMRQHTVTGQRMLDQVGGVLTEVGAVVRGSHERWDGGGYPDGLSEHDIPRAARIVCAADAYSAMTTNRSYRAARSADEAMQELVRCAGAQFDPTVVGALVAVLRRSTSEDVGRGRVRLFAVA